MPEMTHSGAVQRPDWRNAEDYRHMLDYDATSWAGEWLSRNPEFLADLVSAACCSRKDIGIMVKKVWLGSRIGQQEINHF